VHENEFNEQYTSVQRSELYSLYVHIVHNETDTPELSSEESSTHQTDNDSIDPNQHLDSRCLLLALCLIIVV
jgi:hypothetical protein